MEDQDKQAKSNHRKKETTGKPAAGGDGSKAPAAASPEESAGEMKELKEMKEKLEAAEGRAGEYLDDLKRLQAEFDNYRKRMIREQTSIIETANQGLVSKLLPVIDNLERAIASADGGAPEGLAEGVRMVRNQMVEMLEGEGLEEVNPHGHPFDPHVCEAVNTVLTDDHEDETVVEVHQKGYKWKDRLLRPAMATVSKCSSEAVKDK
jgi:molecular chaperone GrpE